MDDSVMLLVVLGLCLILAVLLLRARRGGWIGKPPSGMSG